MTTGPASAAQPILLIRPTLKIAGGFISVCTVESDLEEREVRKLDVEGAPDHEWPGLFELVAEEMDKGQRRFIVDLSRVPWMNSRGLGRLIELWRQFAQSGATAALVCAEGRIRTILEISQVDRIMPPHMDVAAAVAALDEAAG